MLPVFHMLEDKSIQGGTRQTKEDQRVSVVRSGVLYFF